MRAFGAGRSSSASVKLSATNVQVSIAKLERDDAAALGRKIQAAERLFADRSARLKPR